MLSIIDYKEINFLCDVCVCVESNLINFTEIILHFTRSNRIRSWIRWKLNANIVDPKGKEIISFLDGNDKWNYQILQKGTTKIYKWIMKDRHQNYWPCPNKGYDRSNDIIILPGIVSQNQQLFWLHDNVNPFLHYSSSLFSISKYSWFPRKSYNLSRIKKKRKNLYEKIFCNKNFWQTRKSKCFF